MKNTEELQGELLRKSLEEYRSGSVGSKTLRHESVTNRQKFTKRLQTFLSDKPFNENTAREFIVHISTTKAGKHATPSAITTYVGRLRAFCQFLVDQGYI